MEKSFSVALSFILLTLFQRKIMQPLFKKLNLKNHSHVLIINAPESLEPKLAPLTDYIVCRNLQEIEDITFALIFVYDRADVISLAKAIVAKNKGRWYFMVCVS